VLSHGIHGVGPGWGIIDGYEKKNPNEEKNDAFPIDGCSLGDPPDVIGHGLTPPYRNPLYGPSTNYYMINAKAYFSWHSFII
jgi:hypothetical protein